MQATSNGVTVRLRREGDVPAAAEGLIEVHAVDGYPVEGVDHPEAWLKPPGLLQAWVAEQAGTIVGHVAITSPGSEAAVSLLCEQYGDRKTGVAVVARLFVVPEARRLGTGEQLMRAVSDFASVHGIHLVLDVLTKDEAAIRLYARLGWQSLGSVHHLYGHGKQARAIAMHYRP
ncbi:acetyltransferase (GNAT) family protein [Streptomyces sp. 846.5]|nr:GNAT family N-acetyltransferase [Streptomyces sp. 846.5]TDU05607.1 acetyltransferase (GNAT) family protein [Streptomyces sp. 846.5]